MKRNIISDLLWMSFGLLVGGAIPHMFFYGQSKEASTTHQNSLRYSDSPTTQYSDSTTNPNSLHNSTGNHSTDPWITYGHIHIPKTAGTSLNGIMALRYERVCGHKGYTFDAIKTNHRIRRHQLKTNQKGVGLNSMRDGYSMIEKGYNRGRVPTSVMREVGFHDCDWISMEHPWSVWREWVAPDVFQAPKAHLELHLPCRDPIDHLMSMCNHQEIRFQCDLDEEQRPLIRHGKPKIPGLVRTEQQIDSCIFEMDRFAMDLTRTQRFQVKCFDSSQMGAYIDYMDGHLQKRRITEEYIFRESNVPRNKDRECITQTSTEFQQRIHSYLLKKNDYYKFCDSCMGSPNELLLRKLEKNS